MNLPSITRAAVATGFLTILLALPTLAATPPDLTVSTTTLDLGSVVSGAGAHADGKVYFAGGRANKKVSAVVQQIDLQNNTLKTLDLLPTPRVGLGLATQVASPSGGSTANHLYAIGGFDGHGHALNTVEIYDFANNTWSNGTPMPTPRGYLAVVAGTDGNVYAIGGTDGQQPLTTVEVYNPSKNSWSEFAPLNIARSHLAATLGPEDVIYAAGGIGTTGAYLNSVEIAAVGGTVWGEFVPMATPRSDFGLALGADSFLHAAGGKNSPGALNSIEGFNTTTFVWTTEPETLPAKTQGLAAVEGLDGNVYFLGGRHGAGFSTHVVKGVPPALPSHSIVWFFHDSSGTALINGNDALDLEAPLAVSSLQLSILSNTSWSGFPAVNGTIEAGGTVVLNYPVTLGLGLLTTFTLSSTDLDGGSPQVLGQVSELIGIGLFGGTVQIPISTPVTLNNRVLVLNITDVLGVDLNIDFSRFYVTITNVNGTP